MRVGILTLLCTILLGCDVVEVPRITPEPLLPPGTPLIVPTITPFPSTTPLPTLPSLTLPTDDPAGPPTR